MDEIRELSYFRNEAEQKFDATLKMNVLKKEDPDSVLVTLYLQNQYVMGLVRELQQQLEEYKSSLEVRNKILL